MTSQTFPTPTGTTAPPPHRQPTLALTGIEAGYGASTVLHGVDIRVKAGTIVGLLGPNGAGKTTTLRVASGLVRPRRGQVHLEGQDVTALAPNQRAGRGVVYVPEGRGVFTSLSVADNLRLQLPRRAHQAADALERAMEVFPALRERMRTLAGCLSGGQQKMLALARAYMTDASVILVDELSMGLAPLVIDDIFAALRRLADGGASVLVVEQYVHKTLQVADHVVIMNKGAVVHSGSPAAMDAESLLSHYLGS